MALIIAILTFGFLIFVHELGHYLAARLFNVGINEFAIGMGPKIISKKSEKTGIVYSFRLLPIGGFVSMIGEDEDSEDKNALNNKPVWQRMIIVSAGAFMNILVGVLTVLVIVSTSSRLASNVVAGFNKGAVSQECGLMVGDEIIRVGKNRVHIGNEISNSIMFDGTEPIDITVIRDGKQIVIEDVSFGTITESGVTFGKMDFKVYAEKISLGNIVKHTVFYSKSMVEVIWKSLVYLVTGKVGVEQMSGPIGVTSAIGDAAKKGFHNLLYMCSLLALNLGIFNMLPLPALDGGRFVFMLYELIFRKPIKREVEGYIHFAGLCLLFLLMIIVGYNDVLKIFKK
ncbi:MAG: site-2 protease family protein [Ruminococcaceae bacterium]|nr:site-2 protease family protein [Oscillospiraceae bacterium]